MKEHREKNARIPPGSACSDVPGLSVEPPPLGTDCGFTAFHKLGAGCLSDLCLARGWGCFADEGGAPGSCSHGCWRAERLAHLETAFRPNPCPEAPVALLVFVPPPPGTSCETIGCPGAPVVRFAGPPMCDGCWNDTGRWLA